VAQVPCLGVGRQERAIGIKVRLRVYDAATYVVDPFGGAGSLIQARVEHRNVVMRDLLGQCTRGVEAVPLGHRQPECPFCEMTTDSVVEENELAYAVRDAFPVTPLHTLVVPKRDVRSYFELGRPELNACHRLLEQEKEAIERQDANVEGFNVGVNEGEVAGQTVFHCHLHLIPRRRGDVEDPTGGVRSVIPGKGIYR
jgi:ATP adenylyltransferase